MSKIDHLIKQLNKTSEKLTKENKEIFYEIVVYVRASNIKTRDSEEFLQQILDSFINAENRGVTIEEMLGTSDIKGYCKDIVTTYKSSYNFISRLGEYITDLGMIIVMSSLFNFVSQTLISVISNGIHAFTLSLNINLGTIIQFFIIGFIIFASIKYLKMSCFKKPTKGHKIKGFFILWLMLIPLFSIIVLCSKFLDNILTFNLNIIVILIIGIPLYYIGQYLSEK